MPPLPGSSVSPVKCSWLAQFNPISAGLYWARYKALWVFKLDEEITGFQRVEKQLTSIDILVNSCALDTRSRLLGRLRF